MDILLSMLGIIILLALCAGVVFFAIAMAKKIGLIRESTLEQGGISQGLSSSNIKPYLAKLKTFNQSLAFRFVLIVVLVAVMNIPLDMVRNVVSERHQPHSSVLLDIAGTWGEEQHLQGPTLLVPYTEKINTVKTITDKNGDERQVYKTNYYQRTAIVLPEDLKVDVKLASETRQRSLYKAQVYNADLHVTGNFKRPDVASLSSHIDEIHWDRAWLTLGMSDTQAINKVSGLNWQADNNKGYAVDFEPGTKIVGTVKNGFHAPLDLSQDATDYTFVLDLNINGSQDFYFSPFGKTTDVTIQSDWPHPSFKGNVLPNSHDIGDDGFKAKWSIPNLARNYPQLWSLGEDEFDLGEFVAGVDIFESVSLYSKITRAIKYGSLFFILTYINFLIFELGINKRLHLVQYGMIGLALSMFYLSLLSLAEHIGFFSAYLSSAGIIISMISVYAYSAIRHFGRASLIMALLTGLYFMLYSMLKLEETALMSGTVLLLLILAVMMYMTRNIGQKSE